MKKNVTDHFKKAIKEQLQLMAQSDELFAESLKKPTKNIDDCITYILNTVQKSGISGWADNEIFGMAAHYYDEDSIVAAKPVDCKIVINREVQLTDEEIFMAKKHAIEELHKQEISRLTSKAKKPTETTKVATTQNTLF